MALVTRQCVTQANNQTVTPQRLGPPLNVKRLANCQCQVLVIGTAQTFDSTKTGMEGQIENSEGSCRKVLTLGDGDFTFSLDLARWLHENTTGRVHLIATGIDTFSELTAKYKDYPSILKRLRRYESSIGVGEVSPVKVTVLHGLNAVDEVADHEMERHPIGTGTPIRHQLRADEVIFNHPHLGVENAQLHRLFLCHLFRAVERRWLNEPSGVFHLTLVHGQFERWSCDAAARRHGMTLVAEAPFAAPAVETPSYELRRHQSGKSFKSRRSQGESTTYTFVRDCRPTEGPSTANVQGVHPFWIPFDSSDATGQKPFHCSFCDKSFREERSLRNHVLSIHPGDGHRTDERKRKMDDADPDQTARIFECRHCFELGVERSFSSLQALEDHVLAQHSGLHTSIPADWSKRRATSNESSPEKARLSSLDLMEKQSFGTCDVCGFQYQSRDGADLHQLMLLPAMQVRPDYGERAALDADDPKNYSCSYCSKSFRERRAQLQHENRCATRRCDSLARVGR